MDRQATLKEKIMELFIDCVNSTKFTNQRVWETMDFYGLEKLNQAVFD